MFDAESRELLASYEQGEAAAAEAIFARYLPRLLGLIRRRLSSKLRRRLEAEDIVQSAYRSFFLHARNKEYELTEPGDLWRLLAKIALNKLYHQVERHTAARRDVDRDEPLDRCDPLHGISSALTGCEAAIVDEFERALDGLTSPERMVVALRLQGHTAEQIVPIIDRSPRTVRRLLATAEQKFADRFFRHEERYMSSAHPVRQLPVQSVQYTEYTLEKFLNSGAMGKVFLARERRTGNRVAIKAIHKARQTDRRAVSRFLQEATVLAKLRHPHIVASHGAGQFPGGGYFIVMDYIDGADLQSELRQGPLPYNTVLNIVVQTTAAIQYAHDNGVVHCDLKPANILRDARGHVFVTDFGFAHLATDSWLQADIGIGGTAGFIAPEIMSASALPTPAADIYGLGMLIWILASGKCPQDYWKCQVSKVVPQSLGEICSKCLASDPRARFPSARELAETLNNLRPAS